MLAGQSEKQKFKDLVRTIHFIFLGRPPSAAQCKVAPEGTASVCTKETMFPLEHTTLPCMIIMQNAPLIHSLNSRYYFFTNPRAIRLHNMINSTERCYILFTNIRVRPVRQKTYTIMIETLVRVHCLFTSRDLM